MALATVAQVEAIIGEDLADGGTEEARVTTLIGLAQSNIEAELGRPAEGQSITGEIHTAGGWSNRILLDQWPVAAIDAVTERGEALADGTDFRAELGLGIIERIAGTSPDFYPIAFSYVAGGVSVDYTTATIDQLGTLCAQIAARAFLAGRNQAAVAGIAGGVMQGLRQLTIGRWSATADTTAGSDPVAALTLTDADLRLINRWRDRRP